MYRLRDFDWQVLGVLKRYPQGLFLRQIMDYVIWDHVIMPNVYRTMQKLINHEYVQKKGKLYFITRKGMEDMPKESRVVNQFNKSTYAGTAHSFGLAYPLKDSLPAREPPHLYQLAGLPARTIPLLNNSQAQLRIGIITIRLTSNTLFLYTKELYTDNRTLSIETEDAAKRAFDLLALDQEAMLQKVGTFKLRRIDKDTLESHIVKQHWAEEHHPAAEASPSSPLILARSPIDRQKRLGVDMSKGHREWELYHHITADIDKDQIDKSFNAILDGEIDIFDINRIKIIINQISENQKRMDERQSFYTARLDKFSRDIEIHRRVWEKVDKKLSQRILDKWGAYQ